MDNGTKYLGFFVIHSLFLNYAAFGGLFSNTKTGLLLHSLVLPLTLLHWKTNKNACFLTKIEQKLAKNTKYEKWVKDYPLFTQRYLNLFGIHVEEHAIERILRYVFFVAWCITLFKLFSLYRQSQIPPQPKWKPLNFAEPLGI